MRRTPHPDHPHELPGAGSRRTRHPLLSTELGGNGSSGGRAMKKPSRLRKKDLKPGMLVRNTVSGKVGAVLGDPRHPKKLHPGAHPDYVRVEYLMRDGLRLEVAWWLRHVEPT